MRILELSTAALLVLVTAMASHQNGKAFTVLPKSEVNRVSRLCSRIGVPKVEGSWEPTKADIDSLESRLALISYLAGRVGPGELRTDHIDHPANYYRQYVGIVIAKHKLVYLNAFSIGKPPSNWHYTLVDICDGGTAVWGVVYDPETHEFSQLAINGDF